jgi:hypothetical protein
LDVNTSCILNLGIFHVTSLARSQTRHCWLRATMHPLQTLPFQRPQTRGYKSRWTKPIFRVLVNFRTVQGHILLFAPQNRHETARSSSHLRLLTSWRPVLHGCLQRGSAILWQNSREVSWYAAESKS